VDTVSENVNAAWRFAELPWPMQVLIVWLVLMTAVWVGTFLGTYGMRSTTDEIGDSLERIEAEMERKRVAGP
jgi:hypothetical protein